MHRMADNDGLCGPWGKIKGLEEAIDFSKGWWFGQISNFNYLQ